jgi:hypothetical protein
MVTMVTIPTKKRRKEWKGEGECVRGEEYVRKPVVRLITKKLDFKYQSKYH